MKYPILLLLGITLAGCVPTTAPAPNETITQKEINASAAMDMESNREGALAAVATRRTLSASDQVYLVKTIYSRLETDQTKVKLLTMLIQNPNFSLSAKAVILDGMEDGLKVDFERRRVLQLLQERGDVGEPGLDIGDPTTRRL
jgi:hypothetical protein